MATIKDAIAQDVDIKGLSFEERARKWEEEIKPSCDKWGVIPWANMNASPEGIFPVPAIKDLWPKESSSEE